MLKSLIALARVSMLVVNVGVGDGRETCLLAELVKPNTVRGIDENVLKLRHLSTFAIGRHMRLRRGVLGVVNANATATRPRTHRLDTLLTGEGRWWFHLEQPLGVLLINRINGSAINVLSGGMQAIRRDRPIIALRDDDADVTILLENEKYKRYEILENSTLSTKLYIPAEETQMKALLSG